MWNLELIEKKDLELLVEKIKSLENEIKSLSTRFNPLLKPRDVMDRLNITDNVFYKLAREGRLPFLIKVGKVWRCRELDLQKFIDENTFEGKLKVLRNKMRR